MPRRLAACLGGALRLLAIFANVNAAMRFPRLLLPLFCVASLLFAQQVGAAHALGHAVEQQQDKHAPESPACEKCEHYAQLGNALGSSPAADLLPQAQSDTAQHRAAALVSIRTPGPGARAPPAVLRKSV